MTTFGDYYGFSVLFSWLFTINQLISAYFFHFQKKKRTPFVLSVDATSIHNTKTYPRWRLWWTNISYNDIRQLFKRNPSHIDRDVNILLILILFECRSSHHNIIMKVVTPFNSMVFRHFSPIVNYYVLYGFNIFYVYIDSFKTTTTNGNNSE